MFAPGFRISVSDSIALFIGISGAIVAWMYEWWAGMIIGFVVGHFFLFCNVFRIARKPELFWASVFTVLSIATILSGKPGWIVTFTLSFAVAVVLICLEMRKPYYHGVGWRWINPGLPEWWKHH